MSPSPYSEDMSASKPRRHRAPRGEGHLLRGEILEAGRELVTELGSFDDVSVRAVAQRAGISTPAIYLHFADKEALVDAICELVFVDLEKAMEAAVAALGPAPEPLAELRALAESYARFALEHPEEYRVVLMSPPGHVVDTEYILDTVTHRRLVAAVVRCQGAGLFAPSANPLVVSLALWSVVHGVVSLYIARPILSAWGEAVDVTLAVSSIAVCGIAALERLGIDDASLIGGDLTAEDLALRLSTALGPPHAVLDAMPSPPVPGTEG